MVSFTGDLLYSSWSTIVALCLNKQIVPFFLIIIFNPHRYADTNVYIFYVNVKAHLYVAQYTEAFLNLSFYTNCSAN